MVNPIKQLLNFWRLFIGSFRVKKCYINMGPKLNLDVIMVDGKWRNSQKWAD
jgi:hypothetical protein